MAVEEFVQQSISLIMSLRKKGIRDVDVLRAMELVPREQFVLPAFSLQAYLDMALPIDCGQTISQPFVVAFMSEALDISAGHRILEIGTGSGYQTAVLARIGKKVFSIERHKNLRIEAEQRFQELGYSNIVTRTGNGVDGWSEHAPFDRIIVTAAAVEPPPTLIDQLTPDGKLIMPLGSQAGDQFIYIMNWEEGQLNRQKLLPVRFVPLIDDNSVA